MINYLWLTRKRIQSNLHIIDDDINHFLESLISGKKHNFKKNPPDVESNLVKIGANSMYFVPHIHVYSNSLA